MAITHTTGEDFSTGGRYLSDEGWFHFIITHATERPTKKDGSLVNNAMFQLSCVVAAGTAPGCEDKTFDLTLFHPKGDGSNGSKIDAKKIDRTFIALNAITANDQSKAVSVEVVDFVGQQFIAHLSHRDDDGKYLQLHYADIFHVDDPEVKNQPKNEEMLKHIKAAYRRIGNQPPASQASQASAASSAASTPPASTPAPEAEAGAAPLDLETADI